MQIPFGIQAYQHASLPLSAQDMVNCCLEVAPPQAKTQAAVVAFYGVKNWGSAGTKLRGAKVIRNKLYVVSGPNLYRVSSSGFASLLGSIPGDGFVFIEGDETNVMVVEPVSRRGWYWNGTVVAEILVNWPGAVWLGYIDGYFVIIVPDSGQFYITANRNPGSIDGLEFASAEQYPDDLVTGIVDHGELILFGTESGEGFYDSGNADFPLTKIQSASFEVGCMAPRGVAKTDNGIVFPGHDGKVYRLNGYTPVCISTPVVEQAIKKAVDRDFVALAWTEAGHSFYALRCNDFAFVYDFSTNLWSRRESYGLSKWRWEFAVQFGERVIVGDSESNALGELSPDTFTEFGQPLRLSCTSPPIYDENKTITHSRVELVFENGVGLVTGQGSDPMVGLQFSDTDGRTWSSEKWRRLGKIGEFGRRTRWHKLGKSRSRIYRYFITDPVRRTLILATTKSRVSAN